MDRKEKILRWALSALKLLPVSKPNEERLFWISALLAQLAVPEHDEDLCEQSSKRSICNFSKRTYTRTHALPIQFNLNHAHIHIHIEREREREMDTHTHIQQLGMKWWKYKNQPENEKKIFLSSTLALSPPLPLHCSITSLRFDFLLSGK